MDQYLSFWNLMAYDYAGSWDTVSGHNARLFAPTGDNNGFSTDVAMKYFNSKGVAKDKLVLGIPLYGRSFLNTEGPGEPFQGVGQGSWEQGVYDYKALVSYMRFIVNFRNSAADRVIYLWIAQPLPNSQVHTDTKLVASYSYNPSNKEMVSYDTVEIACEKAKYINKNGYLGAMYWEISGDHKPDSPLAIVPSVARQLGNLDNRQNHLNFPESKFKNLRKGMQ
jgi:chitinase